MGSYLQRLVARAAPPRRSALEPFGRSASPLATFDQRLDGPEFDVGIEGPGFEASLGSAASTDPADQDSLLRPDVAAAGAGPAGAAVPDRPRNEAPDVTSGRTISTAIGATRTSATDAAGLVATTASLRRTPSTADDDPTPRPGSPGPSSLRPVVPSGVGAGRSTGGTTRSVTAAAEAQYAVETAPHFQRGVALLDAPAGPGPTARAAAGSDATTPLIGDPPGFGLPTSWAIPTGQIAGQTYAPGSAMDADRPAAAPLLEIGSIEVEVVPPRAPAQPAATTHSGPVTAESISRIGPLGGRRRSRLRFGPGGS